MSVENIPHSRFLLFSYKELLLLNNKIFPLAFMKIFSIFYFFYKEIDCIISVKVVGPGSRVTSTS